jgi:hypothetical protein
MPIILIIGDDNPPAQRIAKGIGKEAPEISCKK